MRVDMCMKLWIFMMIAHISGCNSQGISCFKCTIAPLPGAKDKTSQICSKFDEYNAHYQVYCPMSTLCMKRTFHHKLVNGTIVQTSVERGCALQRNTFTAYDFNKQVWLDKEEIVQEIYEEGCSIGEDRGSPGGPPEYCYCGYHLCNSAETISKQYNNFIIIITSLIGIICSLI